MRRAVHMHPQESDDAADVNPRKTKKPVGLETGANQPRRTRENRVADSSSKTFTLCHVQ